MNPSLSILLNLIMRGENLMKLLLIGFLWVFLSIPVICQENAAEIRKKDLKKYDQARENYFKGEYEEAEKLLEKFIANYPKYVEAYLLYGDILMETERLEEGLRIYRKVVELDSVSYPEAFRIIGNAEFELLDYAAAKESYVRFRSETQPQGEALKWLEKQVGLCDFRLAAMEDPVSFRPYNLGPGVNSPADEYVNTLTADENSIFFTRKSKNLKDGGYRQYEEDFYQSHYLDSTWKDASLLGSPSDSRGDAGAMSVSPDGSTMYFTSCFRTDSRGSCDLYYSKLTSKGWSVPVNLGSRVNSGKWDSQPALSPDGRTIFFTSNRDGGYGQSDIWKTELQENGFWGQPVNLGPSINTAGKEMAPFFHFDNRTLYFASDGHPGMGSLDLFKSSRLDDELWETPENLGYPINTEGDDIAVIVNSRGNRGYLSAQREEGMGNYDIYGFELPTKISPEPVSYMQGTISDALTDARLGASFELIDLADGKLVMASYSDLYDGSYLVCIPMGRNYALNVSKDGYLFYSEHFALEEFSGAMEPFRKDVFLQPIREGSISILKNIFFEFDKYNLLETSFIELNKLAGFMKENPDVKIEVGGHTDNQGSDAYNLELSGKRAGAVVGYLVATGVDEGRISSKGYGSANPIRSNDTEEGRSMNRRTEIKIL